MTSLNSSKVTLSSLFLSNSAINAFTFSPGLKFGSLHWLGSKKTVSNSFLSTEPFLFLSALLNAFSIFFLSASGKSSYFNFLVSVFLVSVFFVSSFFVSSFFASSFLSSLAFAFPSLVETI